MASLAFLCPAAPEVSNPWNSIKNVQVRMWHRTREILPKRNSHGKRQKSWVQLWDHSRRLLTNCVYDKERISIMQAMEAGDRTHIPGHMAWGSFQQGGRGGRRGGSTVIFRCLKKKDMEEGQVSNPPALKSNPLFCFTFEISHTQRHKLFT